MAHFSDAQWVDIFDRLNGEPRAYGLPQRRNGSLVLSSFNIRKFGRLMNGSETKRSAGSWDLLVDYCSRCDLVAIQEVLDDLSSLLHLRERLGKNWSILVSDQAGGIPGERGARERLAFIYRHDRLRHTGMASDITFERSEIFDRIYDNREDFIETFREREQQLIEWQAQTEARMAEGKRPRPRPPFVLPHFIQFIRSPHLAAFETVGRSKAAPYEFIAVNAHLLYGDKSKQREERRREFKALLDWIISRAAETDRVFAPNILLFGDLNLDFKNNDRRREAVARFLRRLNTTKLKQAAKVNFPFLDPHPDRDNEFRTNARANQTYDQIAIVASDDRLPPPSENDFASKRGVNGFDFGMFDFRQLFLDAVPEATNPNTGKPVYSLFEHDVSDHMPIWIRLRRPRVRQREFLWE
ncbi:MAG: endonuclease/exonuclease/phosphatase family protein [Pseudomonadota bacterium]